MNWICAYIDFLEFTFKLDQFMRIISLNWWIMHLCWFILEPIFLHFPIKSTRLKLIQVILANCTNCIIHYSFFLAHRFVPIFHNLYNIFIDFHSNWLFAHTTLMYNFIIVVQNYTFDSEFELICIHCIIFIDNSIRFYNHIILI